MQVRSTSALRRRRNGYSDTVLPQTLVGSTCSRFLPFKHNARLRGWQRINTKLKHNNRNHRNSMGLETPRVDSPS